MISDKDMIRERCNFLLYGILGSKEFVERWWASPNLAFEGTPEETFKVSPQTVYQYLLSKSDGEW